MLRIIAGIVAWVIIGALAWTEWQTQKFMRPSKSDVIAEFEFYSGYTLPENIELLSARRSRPSPLLGDYHTCALVKLTQLALQDFTIAIPYNSSAESWEPGCPTEDHIAQYTDNLTLRPHTYRVRNGDEWYLIFTVLRERIVVIEMGTS